MLNKMETATSVELMGADEILELMISQDLISERDQRLLSIKDEDYNLLTWEELSTIIGG
jgi:hypothetical protein